MNLTLKEQVEEALKLTDDLFTKVPDPPEDMTREQMWAEILRLRGMIKKPKVQDAIRQLLENQELAAVPIPLMASIIVSSFQKHGFDCNCSESSIRWYISQKTMEWSIVRRQDIKVDK